MKVPVLKRGDRDPLPTSRPQSPPYVKIAQNLLNKSGSLLELDGIYGKDTEQAVTKFCKNSLNIGNVIEINAEIWKALANFPLPSLVLPCEVVTFIALEEVGSSQAYEAGYCHPSWPGAESGITIGIGYDLRFADAEQFRADWENGTSPDAFNRLALWLGKRGSKAGADTLSDICISLADAWTVFIGASIPEAINDSRKFYPALDDLHPFCRGALVSLIYNRGPGLGDANTNQQSSRFEMRAIHNLLLNGQDDSVPGLIRRMKRLYPDTSGLIARREREAALWERGLAGETPLEIISG